MALTDKLTAIADGFRASRGTSQKYTLDEMAVLAAEKVGGGGGSGGDGILRVIENVVNIGVGVSVTAEKYYTHFLYNGVRLPRIPDNVLKNYPYVWIRDNGSTGYYDLIMSSSPWWCSTNTSSTVTISTENYTQGIQWYRVQKSSAESETEWTFNQVWDTSGGFGAESNRPIMWSNHDIPNGSATATDIYFAGSEPVPTD